MTNDFINAIKELYNSVVEAYADRLLKDSGAYDIELIKALLEAGVTKAQIVYAALASTDEEGKQLARFFKTE